ncbi:DUF4226 domain-containing protein [Mycobacterium sp. HUMS_1102779]|uniref:DUF4226 domain-containing protein n=1 Tax=Mycobacterium sp. HUMS_1102779 TaxID=3383487 RepID=UPI003899F91B
MEGPTPGAAADAIAAAEAALAQQNSAVSQLDLQVVAAILNAHLTTVEGKEALSGLQQETEAAVRTRSDLDTPAGARDFQRFLIGKLRDIRAVVLDASLDDTSKSALMAAWTSLYGAAKGGADTVDDPPEEAEASDDPGGEWDPLLDMLSADDPGAPGTDLPGPGPAEGVAAPPAVAAPALPALPAFGAGPLSGPGTAPGAPADWALPARGLQDGELESALRDLDDEGLQRPEEPDPGDETAPSTQDAENHDGPDTTHAPAVGPTAVILPDGEAVTAASPQVAAAIKAAVNGTPIAEAFARQGITIPAPGTAVADPIDPQDVTPGDIGVLTDRHALALGPGKALVDGQIRHIATVSGPDFLGWEHPPAATAAAAAPTGPDAPTPTRPAGT